MNNVTESRVASYTKLDAVMLALEAERNHHKRERDHFLDNNNCLLQEARFLREKLKASEADAAKRDEEIARLTAIIAKYKADTLKNLGTRTVKVNMDTSDAMTAIEQLQDALSNLRITLTQGDRA